MALTRLHSVFAKLEGTYGVDPTAAGTDAILVSQPQPQPLEIELLDRELVVGYLGNTEKVASRRMSGVSFNVELAGSGAAGTAPKVSRLLQACSFTEAIVADTSVTLAPTDEAAGTVPSLTLDYYADDTLHKMRGARGSWQLTAEAGQIARFAFNFAGLYTDAAAGTAPTPTFTEQAAPVAFGAANTQTVSVDSFSACLKAFSLDLAGEFPFRQLAGCSEQVRFTQRKPAGEIKIESPDPATKNFFTTVRDQGLVPITLTHGTTAGNIVQITCPSCNFGAPRYEDDEGVQLLVLPFMPNPTGAGNNEISIVFT